MEDYNGYQAPEKQDKPHYPVQTILLIFITGLNLALACGMYMMFQAYRSLRAEVWFPESSAETSSTGKKEPAAVHNNINEMDIELYKAQCQDIPYADIARDSNARQREYFTFVGKIKQVMGDQYRLGVKDGDSYADTIYLDYQTPEGEEHILEGDYVRVWGVSLGFYTYTTVSDTEVTIPRLQAGYLERLTEADMEAMDAIHYAEMPLNGERENDVFRVRFEKLMARPAEKDDVYSGDAYKGQTMLFLLLDIKNIGTETDHLGEDDFLYYVDGYIFEGAYCYGEEIAGYGESGRQMDVGKSCRAYVSVMVPEDWKVLEVALDGAEEYFTIENHLE